MCIRDSRRALNLFQYRGNTDALTALRLTQFDAEAAIFKNPLDEYHHWLVDQEDSAQRRYMIRNEIHNSKDHIFTSMSVEIVDSVSRKLLASLWCRRP